MQSKNINELFLSSEDDGSSDYKSGWNDAVCYIFDTHTVKTRGKEPIVIEFKLDIDEEELAKKLIKEDDGREKR